jgi:hypothetical protein
LRQNVTFRKKDVTCGPESVSSSKLDIGFDRLHASLRLHAVTQVTISQNDAAVDLLEPIAEENRMCVEYTRVSARVTATVATPGVFPGLSLPKFGKKTGKDGKPEQKMREVALPTMHALARKPF